jgi:alpha-L-fucosidase
VSTPPIPIQIQFCHAGEGAPPFIIEVLVDTVSIGGNLLMNVGPTARGVRDERATSAVETYANWMKLHARSIYGCTQSEYSASTDVRYTQNFETKRLYVHIFAYPFKHLHLPGLAGKVKYAQFLHDASEIPLHFPAWLQKVFAEENTPDCLTLALPVLSPDVEVPVIELFLEK